MVIQPPGTTARETIMQLNNKRYKVTIYSDAKHHYIDGNYNLREEFSAMRGADWLGYVKPGNPVPTELWKIDNCRRNTFNLDYLEGKNPFKRYKEPLDLTRFPIPHTRLDMRSKKEITLFAHQREFVCHMLQRRQCIIAGEMGTAKTLAAFIAREMSFVKQCWYIAPKSALTSVKVEAARWGVIGHIRYMTYDELKKVLSEWKAGDIPPQMVIYDESSRIKNETSQRSQAAMYLAESLRNQYKATQEALNDKVFDAHAHDCYIILMSGSPAPKEPLDFYHQCEVACPGYIREGNKKKFEKRLAIMTNSKDTTGFAWNSRVAWRDGNPNVCGVCGLHRAEPCICSKVDGKGRPGCTLCGGVGTIDRHVGAAHTFVPVDNQIEMMYKRMAGLVLVKFKKDCLDLPDKIYRVEYLKPSRDLMSAARIITAKAKSVIESMTLLRELSDGFQYKEIIEKTDICKACKGTRTRPTPEGIIASCNLCSGTGVQNTTRRDVIEIPSPKLDALTDLLDEVEEYGRLVVYAGFTGSIDRICAHVKKLGWEYIRVDGRGWVSSIAGVNTDVEMLRLFQDPDQEYRQIVFVGHPGSSGMGLTLTASSMIVYYSNDFNAESRIQSEDRAHRAGMNVVRGCTIVDLILLPTDKKVLDNLARKRELQSISLGELQNAIDNYSFTNAN